MCILCKSNNLASPTRRRTLAALSMASMAGVSGLFGQAYAAAPPKPDNIRSEEHTSELQSLMRISYAVFCLKKKITNPHTNTNKLKYYTYPHTTASSLKQH